MTSHKETSIILDKVNPILALRFFTLGARISLENFDRCVGDIIEKYPEESEYCIRSFLMWSKMERWVEE